MQKKLDNLKEKMIFEISYWGGLGKYAGKGGYILTSDYELYEYRINSLSDFIKNDPYAPKEGIFKIKTITASEYKKIVKFIETEILSDKYESYNLRDAGYGVACVYNGKIINAYNCFLKNSEQLNYEDSSLYYKASKLITSLT